MRLSASRSCLVAGAKPRRVPRPGATPRALPRPDLSQAQWDDRPKPGTREHRIFSPPLPDRPHDLILVHPQKTAPLPSSWRRPSTASRRVTPGNSVPVRSQSRTRVIEPLLRDQPLLQKSPDEYLGLRQGHRRHGRLRLLHGVPRQTSLWKPDPTRWNNIRFTPLGTDFVRVCRGATWLHQRARNAEYWQDFVMNHQGWRPDPNPTSA